jgi:hypothetical protein
MLKIHLVFYILLLELAPKNVKSTENIEINNNTK